MDNEARLRELAAQDPDALEEALRVLKGTMFVPHPGQVPVIESKARFRALAAGRRFGKTKLGAREIVRAARSPDSMNWWVANSYKNVMRGYKEVVRQIPRSLLAKDAPVPTSTQLILQFKNGATIEFYPAGNPDALAGEGVDFMIVDEAGLIENRVWNQLLRPTLMDTQGDALLISTPRGHNWFWEVWRRGQEGKKHHESWQFSQADNPYIDPEETESAREELPDIIFKQEILAEFIAGGASIFATGLTTDGAILDVLEEPRGQIYVGIDLADKEDFTVISAVREEDHRPVLHERFNQVGWVNQKQQIRDAVRQLEQRPRVESVTVMLDSTGLGDVVYEDLSFMGIDAVPQKFSNDWKEKAVKLLAADLEHGRAFILQDQLPEFEGYEFSMTPAGKYKFEAASGHDDEVSAKLLEHWGMRHMGPPSVHEIEAEPTVKEDPIFVPNEEEGVPPDSAGSIMNRPEVWVS